MSLCLCIRVALQNVLGDGGPRVVNTAEMQEQRSATDAEEGFEWLEECSRAPLAAPSLNLSGSFLIPFSNPCPMC